MHTFNTSKRYILLLGILLITVWQCSIDIYVTAIPSMIKEFGTDDTAMKFSIIIAIIGFGASQVVYGPLSDYYGRRSITLIGLAVYIVGTIICWLTTQIEWLLFGRLVQGLGIGSSGPTITALPKDVFSGKAQNQAFAYISTSIALTPVVAPLLGSYLQTHFGWRADFLFLLLYSVIVGILLFFYFPETNPHVKKEPLNLSQIFSRYIAALSDHLYMGFLLCIVLLYTGELAYVIQMPLILQEKFGLTPIENGWLVILTALGMGFGAFVSSQLVKYVRSVTLAYTGISLVVLSAFIMLILPWSNIYTVTSFVAPMVLYMFGSGMAFNNCIAGCMDRFPLHAGLAGALMGGILLLCSGLLSILVAAMPYTNPFALPLFILACAIFMVLILCSLRKKVSESI